MGEVILTTLTLDDIRSVLTEVLSEVGLCNGKDWNKDNQLLTVQEAAKMLRVSAATVRTKMKAGEIPYQKIGKKALFNKSNLNNLGVVKYKHKLNT